MEAQAPSTAHGRPDPGERKSTSVPAGLSLAGETPPSTSDLPSALDHVAEITSAGGIGTPAVFLDYDGTLVPIADRLANARLPEATRQTLRRLARRAAVAVVSGRDLADVRSLVGLDELIYAGSHGFDIAGPDGLRLLQEDGVRLLPALDRAEEALRDRLKDVPGVQVERKRFAVAVHFRTADPADAPAVEGVVRAVAAEVNGLRITRGKMLLELRPDVAWDKGRAVVWLLGRLGLDQPGVTTLYLGDDLTDEDAFGALRHRAGGIGVVVRDRGGDRPTLAHYALDGPGGVLRFLEALAERAEQGAGLK